MKTKENDFKFLNGAKSIVTVSASSVIEKTGTHVEGTEIKVGMLYY